MRLTIEMRTRPEKARELDQTLHALLPAIRDAKGCRLCRLCRDLEDTEVLFLEVDWDERANLENFIPSPRGGALLGAIELLSNAPRVKIGNDVWMGMEFLKKIRKQKKRTNQSKAGVSANSIVPDKIKPSRKERK